MDDAGDGETIFWFAVGDAVAASDDGTRLGHLISPTMHDITQDITVEIIGEGDEIHGEEDLTAHGVDIGEGVGGGDGAKIVGGIDDGGEEVHGVDNGLFVIETIDSGIIGGGEADEKIGEFFSRERFTERRQHVRQIGWAEFRGSTSASG